MKKKFIQDISANTFQLLINQLCGFAIFYVLSVFLDKTNFGEINFTLAVMLTLFGILACGIDQVTVKKIASGEDPAGVLSLYVLHVLVSGLSVYAILLLGKLFFPGFYEQHQLLLLLGIGKLMIFFSTPFKQLTTGLEKFRPLLYMTTCSNIIRSIVLLVLVYLRELNMQEIIIIFIAGDICELLLCLFITRGVLKIPLSIKWNMSGYKALIKEAAPQLGVAIFTSLMTRFDWIFIGLFTTNMTILANYSFAYKIYEVATLPLLVVAPMLIPRFTRRFHPTAGPIDPVKKNDLFVLLRIEMAIASFSALLLNILWIPVIDLLTQGKYGAVNSHTILLLSASMPFLYLNNFLWTVNFAKGQLKMIFYIFLFSFLLNFTGDILLIPYLQAEGAAIACLLAVAGQSVAYLNQTKLDGLGKHSLSILLCPACALASGISSSLMWTNTLFILFFATMLFILLLLVTRQIRVADIRVLKRVTGF